MDVHEGTATVREPTRFSAHLRQPREAPDAQEDADVEEATGPLEPRPLANAPVSSLGGEARRCVTFGVVLAGKPELLLFLNEPTSGLDGQHMEHHSVIEEVDRPRVSHLVHYPSTFASPLRKL